MGGDPVKVEEMIGRLTADPAFAPFTRPGVGILVWDAAIDRLIWASPAASGLRDAFADADGRVAPSLAARDRLKDLARGLAPNRGMRLERLRLDPSRIKPPVTCACRVATLDDGRAVLVTAIVGAVPAAPVRPQPAPPPAKPAAPEPESAPPPAAAFEPKPRGNVRFVWQADAETRFTHVSPALAEVVGPMASDIIGRTWEEVTRSVTQDPDGAVAALLAERKTFSGHTVHWRLDNTSLQVPVDWAGMPIFGTDRTLTGYRGFGLLRTDAMLERPPMEDGVSAAPADEPADEQDASSVANPGEPMGASPSADEEPAAPEPAEPRSRLAKPEAPSSLSGVERSAFREIARALGARFEEGPAPSAETPPPAIRETFVAQPAPLPVPLPAPVPLNGDRVLDRLPVGILVHRGERILFANRLLLDLVDYDDIGQIVAEGGIVRLFRGSPTLLRSDEGGSPLALSTRHSESLPVEVRLTTVEWDGLPASLMLIRKLPEADATERLRAAEMDLRIGEARIRELESILDTATDGVIVVDETGRILSLNRSAEALFGYDQREVVGDGVTALLAPESHKLALDYLDGLRSSGVASLLNDGREVMGRVRQGGTIPLFMTMGYVNEGPDRKFCAVLRDMTAFKKTEGELVAARHAAEEASAQKSDVLAKISHEIRTPLNAIIGFAEVMLEERFGPIGNDRYKDYLRDVHASGAHVISLVNDLLDLAKIEAGRMDLSFKSVSLNELVSSCVMLLQPQAGRDRIVMRTSFAQKLPPVVADERSVRQIVLNLVSNAIKFTDAGGQVIVSTALTDRGEAAFRVRDTGIGMTEQEIEAALEPFRQLATSRKRGGTGLGLPLTKALVEANRGALQISSNPNEGTLVEVIFPPTRVLAG